VVGLNVIMSRC